MNENVKVVLLFSGKRKSGKDFITENLLKRLGTDTAEILRISAPIKDFWAKEKNLSFSELMGDGPFKETYRQEMIIWSDGIRQHSPGYFCAEATKNASKSIVIISDIRRKTDIKWFTENFSAKTFSIRIVCEDAERSKRGWKFQAGIDDIQSECDLDDVQNWDLSIKNDGTVSVEEILNDIEKLVTSSLISLFG